MLIRKEEKDEEEEVLKEGKEFFSIIERILKMKEEGKLKLKKEYIERIRLKNLIEE